MLGTLGQSDVALKHILYAESIRIRTWGWWEPDCLKTDGYVDHVYLGVGAGSREAFGRGLSGSVEFVISTCRYLQEGR